MVLNEKLGVDTLSQPKKHLLYEGGIGSLKSWYEDNVQGEGVKKIKYDTTGHFSGPLPFFPQLDVMPGAATSENQAFVFNWGLSKSMSGDGIDAAVLNFEETLGGLNGFRIHNNTGYEKENVTNNPQMEIDDLFKLDGDNIDMHSAQAPAGKHVTSDEIAKQSSAVATQHNMGDAQEARDAGLERTQNPAINATGNKSGEMYENKDTLDFNTPMAMPVDIDVIKPNNEGDGTLPQDVVFALGANQSS